MLNYDGLSHDERESIRIMVRSAGWKTLMRHMLIPFLQQTNARLDAMGTTPEQTQFYRGTKATIKHLIEGVYKTGQMPNPFTEHQEAFLLTVCIPEGETVVAERVPGPVGADPFTCPANEAQKELPRKRSLTPVL